MQPQSLRLLLASALCSAAAFAQIGTSTLTGRVTDSTGAVVPKVQVTVVQTSTNFTSNSVTNDEGLYRVLSLQPGVYRITFEAQGFKKSVHEADAIDVTPAEQSQQAQPQATSSSQVGAQSEAPPSPAPQATQPGQVKHG